MNPVIIEIMFALLDLGIRMTTNRQGDQEQYIVLREKLRAELVEEANRPRADGESSAPYLQEYLTPAVGENEVPGGIPSELVGNEKPPLDNTITPSDLPLNEDRNEAPPAQ